MTSADINVSARPNEIIPPFDYEMVPFANELREAAEKIRKRTAACVIDNGRDFSEWRDHLKPGQFRRWVESELGFQRAHGRARHHGGEVRRRKRQTRN